jgi:1-deoxyxylulose-5-phosphate synthase
VKVTRLAFGTETFSGQVQRDLGQDQFNRLVRHAYDRGIRFYETSETYAEMHKTREGVDPRQKIDELRRLANTEYFDVLPMHYQHVDSWPTDTGTLAGRNPRSEEQTGCVGIWRAGARIAGAAADAG